MEIRICGYLPASWLLEQQPQQWHALIILDSRVIPTNFVEAQARSHLYLHFDDIEKPIDGKQLPTSVQIEQGLEFARGKDQLLVSCRAGQGRSAAMAYLIACQEQDASQAIALLDPTKHRPNRRVIEIGDSLLDNPDVLDLFDSWRVRNNEIQLSYYYDELEKELDFLAAKGAQNKITSI